MVKNILEGLPFIVLIKYGEFNFFKINIKVENLKDDNFKEYIFRRNKFEICFYLKGPTHKISITNVYKYFVGYLLFFDGNLVAILKDNEIRVSKKALKIPLYKEIIKDYLKEFKVEHFKVVKTLKYDGYFLNFADIIGSRKENLAILEQKD